VVSLQRYSTLDAQMHTRGSAHKRSHGSVPPHAISQSCFEHEPTFNAGYTTVRKCVFSSDSEHASESLQGGSRRSRPLWNTRT
jgi:hypothetical protein